MNTGNEPDFIVQVSGDPDEAKRAYDVVCRALVAAGYTSVPLKPRYPRLHAVRTGSEEEKYDGQ